MSLASISVRNPVFAWMLMLAILLFGGIAFTRLGVSQLPDVDFPVVTVHVNYTGASPEVMEADIIDVIEDAVMSVQGIKRIYSSAKAEQATVVVEFDLDRNIDLALQDIQSKVSQVQRLLPVDMDPPTILKNNPDDQPIMWVALSGDWDPRKIMAFARDQLKDKMQTVSGVSEIILSGYLAPSLRVWVDPHKLAQYDLTVLDVMAAIEREHAELPAGRLETDTRETNLRFMGEALTPAEFEKIIISRRGGAPNYAEIYLKDVARIEAGMDDVRRISRFNGKTAIGLGIKKQRGSNAVAVTKGIRERLEEIKKELPAGLDLAVSFDSTKFIEEATDELKFNLLLSAILTALVCLVFIGSISATINIVMAIPVSLVGTFLFLYFFGYTLNTFTLLGLILSIGIVVDDAIMVLENIMRRKSMGENPQQAAISGTNQIQMAALAATLALVVIFIPVVFMKGFIGKLFLQFGVTLSVAVMFSLFEAMTFMPMRTAQIAVEGGFLSGFARRMDAVVQGLENIYRRILVSCLRFRWIIIVASLSLFGGSVYFAKYIPQEFMPAQDQSMFLMRLKAPVGSSIEFTNRHLIKVENLLMQDPAVLRYFSAVGGFSGGEVDSGMIFVTLKEPSQRPLDPATGKPVTQQRLAMRYTFMSTLLGMIEFDYVNHQMRSGIAFADIDFEPDVRGFAMDLSMRGFTAQRGFPIEFSIRGPDWDKLAEYSKQIVEAMRTDTHFSDVDSTYVEGMPEIRILPDREAARLRGVGMEDMGMTLGALFGGMRAGKFTDGGKRADVRVRLEAGSRMSKEDIAKTFVRNYKGEMVPLIDLVKFLPRDALQGITREDRERSIGIQANVGENSAQADALKKAEEIAKKILPEEYRAVFGGSSQAFSESFGSLRYAFILGLVLAYMILASQYNSLLDPVSVFMALPFSITGAIIGLLLTGHSFNMYSYIGLILLMGIVKKNSILLVDFTRQKREEGFSLDDALLAACPSRLRAILMTSVATIAGAIPPALALGPGSETRIPMAVVILGGVIFSTVLTLFVVPCVYRVLGRFQKYAGVVEK